MKSKAIMSLVFGICGILLSFIPYVGFAFTALSIVGIVFATLVLKSQDTAYRKLAIAGLVCSILGVLFGLPAAICVTACTCATVEVANTAVNYANNADKIADAIIGIGDIFNQ